MSSPSRIRCPIEAYLTVRCMHTPTGRMLSGKGDSDDNLRTVWTDPLGDVENNPYRIDDPGQRRLGLPICRAAVARWIQPIDPHLKGTEPFWNEGEAEALLPVRAASVSGDGRAERPCSRPRPHSRAKGTGHLSP